MDADCRLQRTAGCSRLQREKDSQGQGRDRKKEGVPSPASTSIAIPGRRSRSRRQMRIWKYAMLQTRVDGEAVQQPSGLPGRRSLGPGSWGRRDGRDGGKTQVQVQVQAPGAGAGPGRRRCRCRCGAGSAHACAGGPRCGLDKQGGGDGTSSQRRTTRRISLAEVALGSHTWHLPTHPSLHPSVPPSLRLPPTHPSVRLPGCTYRYVACVLDGDAGPCTCRPYRGTRTRWTAAFCRASSYPPAHPVATTDAHTLTAVSGPMGLPKSNHQTGYFEHPRLPRSWSSLLSRASRASRCPAARTPCTDRYLFVQCFRCMRMGNSSISNWILPTLQPSSPESEDQTIYPILLPWPATATALC